MDENWVSSLGPVCPSCRAPVLETSGRRGYCRRCGWVPTMEMTAVPVAPGVAAAAPVPVALEPTVVPPAAGAPPWMGAPPWPTGASDTRTEVEKRHARRMLHLVVALLLASWGLPICCWVGSMLLTGMSLMRTEAPARPRP